MIVHRLGLFLTIACGLGACTPTKLASPASSQVSVVGGTVAPQNAYPFMVSIFLEQDRSNICGGSLIAPGVVVTAAHCFAGVWFASWKFFVRIGKHNMRHLEEGEELLAIDKIVIHENFSDSDRGIKNDIALVFLHTPSKFAPIKLNRDPQLPEKDSLLRLLGWGKSDEFMRQNEYLLRQVDVPVIDQQTCDEYSKLLEVEDHQICAGYLDRLTEKDACKGDSGGPLFNPEGEKKLLGIVSSGIGCARAKTPGFYTRISSFVEWIEKKTGPLPQ